MCYTKPRTVLGPKRLEMHCQADLPPSIHLLGLAVELRELELRCGSWVGDRDIELEIELVLEEVVDVPALAGPTCPLGIGRGDSEPIVIVGLVHLGVGDQSLVLLLQPLRPCRPISRPGLRRQQWDLG